MRISDWSSDVCSSDLIHDPDGFPTKRDNACRHDILNDRIGGFRDQSGRRVNEMQIARAATIDQRIALDRKSRRVPLDQEKTHARLIAFCRSEEHTSELQSLIRISYAVFCLKKKKRTTYTITATTNNNNR